MKIKDRVLTAGDESHISSFIAMILTANDYDTMTARIGSEAITTITSHCPDVMLLEFGIARYGRHGDIEICLGVIHLPDYRYFREKS